MTLNITQLIGFGGYQPAGGAAIIPESDDWQDIDAQLTFGTGSMDATGEGSGRTVATFTGDVTITFTVTAETNFGFGCYASAEDATYSSAPNHGGMDGMTLSFFYNGGDDTIKKGNSNVATGITWSGGDVAKWERVGTTVTIYKNDISQGADSISGTIRLVIGSGSGVTTIDDIQWTE